MTQLLYYDFIVDIKHRFICGEPKLKCCKAPKCYVQDCLMILHLLSTILPSSNDSCLWNTPVFILKRKLYQKKDRQQKLKVLKVQAQNIDVWRRLGRVINNFFMETILNEILETIFPPLQLWRILNYTHKEKIGIQLLTNFRNLNKIKQNTNYLCLIT